MADEDSKQAVEEAAPCDCPPVGAPAWMATFSDLVTLLMTFFVLLYATSKQDDEKFKSVAGSIRKAFAGNALKSGEVPQLGKSPDNSPTMIDAQEPVQPFPIDFMTTEGILDKHEMNRSSEENLQEMKDKIREYALVDAVEIYEINEGIKVKIKDYVFFKQGTIDIENINAESFQKMIKLLRDHNWNLVIEGHAKKGETYIANKNKYSFSLSAERAEVVTRSLIKRGIRPEQITTMFYGASRDDGKVNNARVEFTLRKIDIRSEGKKVKPY